MPIRRLTFCRGPEAPVTGSDLACAWLRCTVVDPPAAITRSARQAASFAGFTFHIWATSRSLWPGGRPPRPPTVHSRRPRSGRISDSATPFSYGRDVETPGRCRRLRLPTRATASWTMTEGASRATATGWRKDVKLVAPVAAHIHGAGQRSTCERLVRTARIPLSPFGPGR